MTEPVPNPGMVRRVTPIYGNGWFPAATDQNRELPDSFDFISSDGASIGGMISTPAHEFEDAVCSLAPRHVEPTGDYNVTIARNGATIALGFARLR